METLNFIFKSNKIKVDEYLNSVNYKNIGDTNENPVGYCIFIKRKQYFEITSLENKNITKSDNFSDLKLYCN